MSLAWTGWDPPRGIFDDFSVSLLFGQKPLQNATGLCYTDRVKAQDSNTMDQIAPAEKTLLRIGDVAQRTGITLRTLRYYEELALIEPDNRTKGNFRLYSPSVVQRVQFINSLKKLDFSLEEIRDVLGPANDIKNDCDVIERTRKALLVKKEKITAKLIEMADMNREVDISLRILEDCARCQQENNHCCDPGCENKHAHIQ